MATLKATCSMSLFHKNNRFLFLALPLPCLAVLALASQNMQAAPELPANDSPMAVASNTPARHYTTAVKNRGAFPAQTVSKTGTDLTLFSLKKNPPQVDGILNDPCWHGAQVAGGFMTQGKTEKATVGAEALSCYDQEKIYFAVKLEEPDIVKLKVNPLAPYAGDCAELFLDPENKGRSYFHIVVDSQGNRYAGFNDGTERQLQLDISAKTGRSNGYWTIEMAIPFAALNASPPQDNQRWGFNVGRERYTISPRQNTSWAALGSFNQQDRFGKLAFYSHHEIVADMAYWDKSDRDPLMMRPFVSGYEIAMASVVKRKPTLWTYDPFGAKRGQGWKTEAHKLKLFKTASETGLKKHPEFFRAAQGINRFLVGKAKADDGLSQLRRQVYYYTAGSIFPLLSDADATALLPSLEKESAAIDKEMNSIYTTYGTACDAEWNKDLLAGLDARISTLSTRIAAFRQHTDETQKAISREANKISPWHGVSLIIPIEYRMLNADGATRRFSFSAYGIPSSKEEPYSLLTAFDSSHLSWPSAIPSQPKPGVYEYEYIDKMLQNSDSLGFPKALLHVTFGLSDYTMPLSPALTVNAKTDSDILLRSQDGLTGMKYPDWGDSLNIHTGVNPNNPEVKAYAHDYLKNLSAHVVAGGKMDFFITAWESSDYFYASKTNGAKVPRSLGYNESGKQAFRNYLKDRYSKVKTLNRKWRAAYSSFDAIEPPDDKYINPSANPSGLLFEFERWHRVNWVKYIADLRASLKSGAPEIPVQADTSTALAEMNGYLLFKENGADIYSYHFNPLSEEAIWTYFSTMRRKFGKELGYQENYFQLYAAAHLKDERLAQHDVRKWFFDLLMHDIRYSSWWLSYYNNHKTDYIVAYGGGFFGVDYDQTIMRWSMAELAPMFTRCRNIEKALLESSPEVPKTAIVQPCTTIFTLSSIGKKYGNSTAIQEMFNAHYRLLLPGNYPHDYLPEEMALDKMASLDEYTLLVLPYAPYMTEAFSRRLMDWVKKGGILIAFGPFALMDEAGYALPAESSLFRALFPGMRVTSPGDWATCDNGSRPPPKMTSCACGKGSVAYLNCSADVAMRNASIAEPLLKLLADAGERTAVSSSPDLKIIVREKSGGAKYLCLRNNNVEAHLETTVIIKGVYKQALDIVVPGWFPVPSEIKDGQTFVKVRLDPGDFTMILLQP